MQRCLHFRFSYHGYDVKPLHENVAHTVGWLAPELHWQGPIGQFSGETKRVGIIFEYQPNHAMSIAFENWFKDLSKHDCEVIQITRNRGAMVLDGVDKVFILDGQVGTARSQLTRLGLDFLMFTEIGMDVFTYLLGFARMARVQAVAGGHPVTTGCPEIDDFVAPGELETASGQSCFCENLVRIPGLDFPRQERFADVGEISGVRDSFGFSPSTHIYYIPNGPHKILPEFDEVIADILEGDPDGVVLLALPHRGARMGWDEKIFSRLSARLGGAMERVHWHWSMEKTKFAKLCAEVDVVLDTPGFGMGTTGNYPLWYGTPVIGFDGAFLRERNTVSILRRYGLEELIAKDSNGFARKALEIGKDREARLTLRKRMRHDRERVFESGKFSKALARYVADRISEGDKRAESAFGEGTLGAGTRSEREAGQRNP